MTNPSTGAERPERCPPALDEMCECGNTYGAHSAEPNKVVNACPDVRDFAFWGWQKRTFRRAAPSGNGSAEEFWTQWGDENGYHGHPKRWLAPYNWVADFARDFAKGQGERIAELTKALESARLVIKSLDHLLNEARSESRLSRTEGAREGIKRAAEVADGWAKSASCTQHSDDPCCHVRTGAGIAAKIRALAGEFPEGQ